MSELSLQPKQLPEATDGSPVSESLRLQSVELQRVLESPDGVVEYRSYLPEVIGYVPEEERDLFDSLNFSSVSKGWAEEAGGMLDRINLAKAFPGISRAIEQDFRNFGISLSDTRFNMLAEFERRFVAGGELARPSSSGFHTDELFIEQGRVDAPFFYLISNNNPTNFYEGSVNIEKSSGDRYTIFKDTVTEDGGSVVQAPSYAVVRLHPLTVHASPIFEQPDTRTFCRVTALSEAMSTEEYIGKLSLTSK